MEMNQRERSNRPLPTALKKLNAAEMSTAFQAMRFS